MRHQPSAPARQREARASPLRKERSPLRPIAMARLRLAISCRLHRSERSGLHCGIPMLRPSSAMTNTFTAPKGAVSIAAIRKPAALFLGLSPSPLRKERSPLRRQLAKDISFPTYTVFTAPKGAVSIAALSVWTVHVMPGSFTAPKGAVSIAALACTA